MGMLWIMILIAFEMRLPMACIGVDAMRVTHGRSGDSARREVLRPIIDHGKYIDTRTCALRTLARRIEYVRRIVVSLHHESSKRRMNENGGWMLEGLDAFKDPDWHPDTLKTKIDGVAVTLKHS